MRIAHGYYALVPEERRLDYWKPTIEGVALGVAVADYGRDGTALMGITAARLLGVVPARSRRVSSRSRRRAGSSRPSVGTVEFVTRKVATLDVQRVDTEVTAGWATTPEQTALDLADRPGRGAVAPPTVTEALRALGPRCDLDLVARLATEQHKRAGWRRLAWVLDVPLVHVGERRADVRAPGSGRPWRVRPRRSVISAREVTTWAEKFGVAAGQIRRDHFISHFIHSARLGGPGRALLRRDGIVSDPLGRQQAVRGRRSARRRSTGDTRRVEGSHGKSAAPGIPGRQMGEPIRRWRRQISDVRSVRCGSDQGLRRSPRPEHARVVVRGHGRASCATTTSRASRRSRARHRARSRP